MTWTNIAGTRYDAESIAVEALFTDMILNTEHLFDGSQISTDLVTQTSIAAAAVGQGELKTATEDEGVSHSGGPTSGYVAFSSVADYPFDPLVRIIETSASSGQTVTLAVQHYASATGALADSGYVSGYLMTTTHSASGSRNGFMYSRYVTATEPHYVVGRTPWGAFVYLLMVGDRIVRAHSMADAPGYMDALRGYRDAYGRPDVDMAEALKLDPRLHALRPHPWHGIPTGEVAPGVQGLPAGARVVLLDLRHLEQDSPRRWRPDTALAADAMQRRDSAPQGTMLWQRLDSAATKLLRRKEVADSAQAAADQALADFPQTPKDFVEPYVELEVEALGRRRESMRALCADLEEAAAKDDRPEVVADLRERIAGLRSGVTRTEFKLAEARRSLPERRAKAMLNAPRLHNLARLQLRKAANLVTLREELVLTNQPIVPTIMGEGAKPDWLTAALGGADILTTDQATDVPDVPGVFTSKAGSPPAVTILTPR